VSRNVEIVASDASSMVNLASTRSGVPDVKIEVTVSKADIQRMSDDSDPLKPHIIASKTRSTVVHEDSVSVAEFDGSDEIFVQRHQAEMVIAVFGNEELIDRMRCARDDTGKNIGVYHPQIPMFLAHTYGWASLQCSFVISHLDDRLDYKLVIMSGRKAPVKEMVLEIIGRYLTQHEINGKPLTGPQIQSISQWLLTSLGARFTKDDLLMADNDVAKELIKTLIEAEPGTAP
jgi:hypothetical protein